MKREDIGISLFVFFFSVIVGLACWWEGTNPFTGFLVSVVGWIMFIAMACAD